MLGKKMDTLKLGISGVAVFFLGLLIIVYRELLITKGVPVGGCILMVMALLSYFKHRNLKVAIPEFILGLIQFFYSNLPLALFSLTFSLVFLLHAFAHGVTMILDFRNRDFDWIKEVFLWIYYHVFALIILFNPLSHLQGILVVIGVYLCLYGVCDLFEALMEHFKIHIRFKHRQKVRIQIPPLLGLLIPTQVLKAVETYCEEQNESTVYDSKDGKVSDLEVLIHMTPTGYSAAGHVDICYRDYVITYGNYDAASYRLMDAIGDGVLMVVPKETYIPFCQRDSGKTLVGFGLTLTKAQKSAMHRKIKKIFDNLEEWECNYKKAERKNDLEKMQTSLKYYANRIYKDTKARMYKFKKGKFKTYFVLTTNCVLLADSILGKVGLDTLGSKGIITPGTYYDYLNRQFTKRKSQVISRTVYH